MKGAFMDMLHDLRAPEACRKVPERLPGWFSAFKGSPACADGIAPACLSGTKLHRL